MNIQYRDADIREELKKVSNQSSVARLENIESDLSSCFDFVPSEDYDELYRFARAEKMRADAFEDVMLTLLRYINFMVENTNAVSRSRLTITAYQDTFNAAISRVEALERDLDTQKAPTINYL